MSETKKNMTNIKNIMIPIGMVGAVFFAGMYMGRLSNKMENIEQKQIEMEATQITEEKVQIVVETALDKKFYEWIYTLDDRYVLVKKNDT